jgi:hypothetical protein
MFGTRGSQVQILPLRPIFSKQRSLRGLIWGTKLHVAARHTQFDGLWRLGQARAPLPPTRFRRRFAERIVEFIDFGKQSPDAKVIGQINGVEGPLKCREPIADPLDHALYVRVVAGYAVLFVSCDPIS